MITINIDLYMLITEEQCNKEPKTENDFSFSIIYIFCDPEEVVKHSS